MPMIDLQRRWAEAFRIRLGEKKLTANGKERPAALDGQIRITSQSPEVIDAVVRAYGGVTSESAVGYEVRLSTDHLRIVVLPGDSIVGWWEQWRRKDGGMPVCTHRCDGRTNIQTGGACTCPPVEDRLADREHYCQPTTRLWVMLPEVEVIGTGRLETHGRIAAETLPQSVEVLRSALSQGELIPAVLRIIKVESSGRSFVVPRIEVVGRSLDQLLTGEAVVRSLPPSPVSALPASPPSERGEGGPARGTSRPQGPPPAAPPPPDVLDGGDQGGEDVASWVTPTTKQINAIRKKLAATGVTREQDVLDVVSAWIGWDIESLKQLSQEQVEAVLAHG